MTIQAAKWFDDSLYMKNKLAQMKTIHPNYTQTEVNLDYTFKINSI